MKFITIILLVFFASSLFAQSNFFICGDCSSPAGKTFWSGFFSEYYEMTKKKKNTIALTGNAYPEERVYEVTNSEKKNQYNDKYLIQQREDIYAGKVPYIKKDGNKFQFFDSLVNFDLEKQYGRGAGYRKQFMKKEMLKALQKLDKTKPITIHVAGHGWNEAFAGEGKLPPEKSGFALRTPQGFDTPKNLILTHEEFGEVMKEAGLTGPNAPSVRIIGTHCYGGGVHYLAEKFPNICSVSFSSNEDIHYSAEDLPRKFWQNYNKLSTENDKQPSLSQTFNSLIPELGRNRKGAALGSTQFVRNVLKEKGIEAPININYNKTWNEFLFQTNIDSDFSLTYSCSNSVLDMIDKDLFDSMKDIDGYLSTLNNPLFKGIDLSMYKKAFTDLKHNHAQYKEATEQYFLKISEFQQYWAELSEQEKIEKYRSWNESLGDFASWALGQFEKTKKKNLMEINKKQQNLLNELSEINQELRPRVLKYYQNIDLLRQLNEVKQFFKLHKEKKISNDQFKTYLRMLECESKPL